MLFWGTISLFNHSARTDRQDYYGNIALCPKVHSAVKKVVFPEPH